MAPSCRTPAIYWMSWRLGRHRRGHWRLANVQVGGDDGNRVNWVWTHHDVKVIPDETQLVVFLGWLPTLGSTTGAAT